MRYRCVTLRRYVIGTIGEIVRDFESSAELVVFLQSFYLTMRQAVLHSWFSRQPNHRFLPLHEKLPYSDLPPSTKIGTMLRIVVKHLYQTCATPLSNLKDKHGNPVAGVIVEGDNIRWTAPAEKLPTDKIIIYLTFPSNNWIVRSVRKPLHVPTYTLLTNNIGTERTKHRLCRSQWLDHCTTSGESN